jgi:flagellin-like protein
MNNKGASEIISQILLMLITVVVVGIIISALIPQISRSKSQIKFEESKILRDELFFSIQEVYNNPIGYTKEISLKLENLNLNIDGDTETIEIYSIINGEFYKDGLRQEEDNGKYTYRNGQKLYVGFTLENIDLVRSYVLENQLNITIYLRKTDKDKITVLLENVIEDNWFTASNLGLYDENKSTWQYRKKILIDHNKVDGNLTNFPVLIYLEDSDLNLYANADGNDIIFTSKDGKTKLKREIESIKNINTYRKKITIDHTKVDSNLIDFPMLISITDENLSTYAQNDGSDIYFTTND